MGVYYVIIQEKDSEIYPGWRFFENKDEAVKEFVRLSWSDQESNWRIFEEQEGGFESVEIGSHVHYGKN